MSKEFQWNGQRNILILMEWYNHHLRMGIGQYARHHDWHLTVDERARVPVNWQGDGVLTVFHQRQDIATYLSHLKIPVVSLSQHRSDIDLPRVTGDHQQVGILAAEHFAERGFQHVAWFSTTCSPPQVLRFTGLCHGCRTQGLRQPYRWIWEEVAGNNPEDWQGMRNWLATLLHQTPKPLAILAYNDYDASKILDICRMLKTTVPEEIAILGVDDNELICLNQPVPLSSIRHDLVKVGYQGAQLLDALIDGVKPPSGAILIPPSGITLRQSTDQTAIPVPTVREAIRFIKDNLYRSFGVDEVAGATGVSRSTLDRLFQQHLARSVHSEILRARLAMAKHLLTRTDLPLSEIAQQSGFCHAQYFNNVFRKTVGHTPHAYRKQHMQVLDTQADLNIDI